MDDLGYDLSKVKVGDVLIIVPNYNNHEAYCEKVTRLTETMVEAGGKLFRKYDCKYRFRSPRLHAYPFNSYHGKLIQGVYDEFHERRLMIERISRRELTALDTNTLKKLCSLFGEMEFVEEVFVPLEIRAKVC